MNEKLTVNEEQLATWDALANAATRGPWRVGDGEPPFCEGTNTILCDRSPNAQRVLLKLNQHFPGEADAAFIVAAREAVPVLIDQLREAERQVASAREAAQLCESERDVADERAFKARVEAETKLIHLEHGGAPEGSMLDKLFTDLATWKAGAEHEQAKRREMEQVLAALGPMAEGITQALQLAANPEIAKNYVVARIALSGRDLDVTIQVPGGMTPAQHIAIKDRELAAAKQEIDRLNTMVEVERNVSALLRGADA